MITGASSGIGCATATRLAQCGYRTVLMARRADRLEALRATLGQHAPSFAYPVDLSNPDHLHEVVQRALRDHGVPDVLVSNAGYGLYRPFAEHTAQDHRTLMEVNYFASVWLISAVLPGMIERGSGHVIGVASISTKMGPWGHTGYSAAKCALVSMIQTLAAEHTGSGVDFSYINPGVVRTDYFEQPSFSTLRDQMRKRWIEPERIAEGVLSLLKRPRLELCIPRHYRVLDWLGAISPALLHRLVRSQSRPKAESRRGPLKRTTPTDT
ncbi:MAG: SDR family oxidoreductase [Nitrococcus sp.]|nr:SDR family oxidoreductase [Nitrococcus sp.]